VKSYVIVRTGGGYYLTVPETVRRLVPSGTKFVLELVDEGLLYRVVRRDGQPLWAVQRDDERDGRDQ
jgi:hypothetical protein